MFVVSLFITHLFNSFRISVATPLGQRLSKWKYLFLFLKELQGSRLGGKNGFDGHFYLERRGRLAKGAEDAKWEWKCG